MVCWQKAFSGYPACLALYHLHNRKQVSPVSDIEWLQMALLDQHYCEEQTDLCRASSFFWWIADEQEQCAYEGKEEMADRILVKAQWGLFLEKRIAQKSLFRLWSRYTFQLVVRMTAGGLICHVSALHSLWRMQAKGLALTYMPAFWNHTSKHNLFYKFCAVSSKHSVQRLTTHGSEGWRSQVVGIAGSILVRIMSIDWADAPRALSQWHQLGSP